MIHRDNAARAALALALGICAGAAMPSPARAQDATPANRFFGGASVDHMFGFDLSVDGKPVAEPIGKSKNGLFLLGIDRIVARWLAVGVEGHIATWNTAWSDAAGYDSNRFLFDLDAVMRFRFPLVGLFPTSMTFSLSPYAGFTWAMAPSRETSAVTERWQPRRGGNAGIELTGEIWFPFKSSRWRFGVAGGISYTRHWFSLDGEFVPISDPGAAVSARYDYVVDRLGLKVAGLIGF